ncbi:MAG: DUF6513 domain-containing protein [Candidatus Hydrothermarchaeota archaeon]
MAKYLFVTGRLGEEPLRSILASMKVPFQYEVKVLDIKVAALANTEFIARSLEGGAEGCEKVVIPGLCRGGLEAMREKLGPGVEVVRGPKDLLDLPTQFGLALEMTGYGEYATKILAEVNEVPHRSREEVLRIATHYKESGAEIIDLGGALDKRFEDLAGLIAAVKDMGCEVSVDTFDRDDILAADDAGADYILSINSSNMDIAQRLDSRLVVIPDFEGDETESLGRNIARLEEMGAKYIIDPILNPPNFGFARSLSRYAPFREHYPDREMLMGIGNTTELTEADSTGMNALLLGFVTELGIEYVLTTEASNRTWGAVREVDVARRLMHFSNRKKILPKGIDRRLVALKDPKLRHYTEAELRQMHEKVEDPNFRIFTDGAWIYIFNDRLFLKTLDLDDIPTRLGVKEPSHAYYLGKELTKAALALKLRKNYLQEQELDWGYLGGG